MAYDNLLDFLTNLIAEQLARQAPPPNSPKPGTRNLGLNTTRGGRQPGLGNFPASAAHFPTLPPAPPRVPAPRAGSVRLAWRTRANGAKTALNRPIQSL